MFFTYRISNALLAVLSILVALTLVGCASSEVTQRQSMPGSENIDRPDQIFVYSFAATPGDIAPTAEITGYYDQWQTAQTPQQIELGRQLGAQAANKLVDRLRKMGMRAQRAGVAAQPGIGDIVITGALISLDEGSRGKRVVIGFGRGSGELSLHAEGYLVTPSGHQQLGSRQVDTSGSRMPGVAVPAAMRSPVGLGINTYLKVRGEKGAETLQAAAERAADQLADELQQIFQEKGWL